jgi:hypothetical protein
MDEELILKDLEEYLENANKWRGNIISRFNQLEGTLGFVLAHYFLKGDEKLTELLNSIIDRLSFEQKRSSLKAIIDKIDVKDGFKKTKNNSWPSNKNFDRIRRLNDQRNYFAHYEDVSFRGKHNKVIGLTMRRDEVSPKIISYTKDELNSIIKDINECEQYLVSYLKKFHPESV